MSTFSADTGDMQIKAQAVLGTIERLRGEVTAMATNLNQLEATWHGAAAASFHAVIAEWHGTHLRIEESLSSIASALHHASAQYEEVEHANASMFRF